MRLVNKTRAALAFGALLFAPAAPASIILTFFPASDYNPDTAVMDATLGLTGDTIDTFETTTLIPGLSITLSGGEVSTPVTWTSLPNLYNASVCSGLGIGAWDGTDAVINIEENQLNNCDNPTGVASLMTFNYAPGTTFFGISLSNFQSTDPASPSFPITNHELFVDGVAEGTIESLAGANWSPGIVRNAYLEIDATGGSSITSVGFENLSAPDALVFDHLAVTTATPEPGSDWLLSAALVPAAVWWRKRSRRETR